PQAPFFPHQAPMGRGFPGPHAMPQRWATQPGHFGRAAPIPGQPGPMQFGPGGMRGGRGGRGGRGNKMRYTQNVRNQRPLEENGAPHSMEQPVQQQPVPTTAEQQGSLTLANLS